MREIIQEEQTDQLGRDRIYRGDFGTNSLWRPCFLACEDANVFN